jgi:hypothetical protein
MFILFISFLSTLRSCFQTRSALQLEILALRHQMNVLRRSQRGRIRLTEVDRLLWTWLLHLWSGWRSVLIIVKPETVIAWHRRGFRQYWTWKSRQGRPGREQLIQRGVKGSRGLRSRMRAPDLKAVRAWGKSGYKWAGVFTDVARLQVGKPLQLRPSAGADRQFIAARKVIRSLARRVDAL